MINMLKINRKKLAIADSKGNTSENLLHNSVLVTTMYDNDKQGCFSLTEVFVLVALLLLSIGNDKITMI